MATALIVLQKVNKWYGNGNLHFHALKDIDLVINKGEFVTIIGPSGSGKTTLMNILGGLDRFNTGKLLIDGKNIKTLSEQELAHWRGKTIGFIFQAFNLINRYTVLENVLLPTIYNPIKNEEKKALQVLKQVGLEGKESNTPLQLSGGQKQRVAIARALILNPSVILADEPTGNLDTKTGIQIMELLKDLNQQGKTIILITHNPKLTKYSNRKIIIQDGKIMNKET